MSNHAAPTPAQVSAEVTKVASWVFALQREIVLARSGVPSFAGVGVTYLVTHGYIPTGEAGTANTVIGYAAGAVMVLAGHLWARRHVTPSNPGLKPVASTGERLVTVSAAVAAAGRPVLAAPAVDPAIAALANANAIHPAA